MGEGEMKAVIIAGGRGARMGRLTETVPKPLLEVAGKPVIVRQIEALRRNGIKEVYVLSGYLGHIIRERLGDGGAFGVRIGYVQEDRPLGTSGCVKALEGKLDDDFLVIYGDLVFEIDFSRLASFHRRKNSSATLVVHPNDHPRDSDIVLMEGEHRITGFLHGGKPLFYPNLANAAIYMLSPRVFGYMRNGASDFVRDIFPAMLKGQEMLYGYKTSEYVKDMGTLDRLEAATSDILRGTAGKLSRANARPAVFIDRDGTLVKDIHLLHALEDLELYRFSARAVRKLNKSCFLSLVITNQPVVARNLCTVDDVKRIHEKMETLLGGEGAYLDAVYFCPHHPDKGYEGENPAYKMECGCRKPSTGMIDEALSEFNIDIGSSWLVGDTTADIQTGLNAGLKTILVRTGHGGRDGKLKIRPHYIFDDFGEAVDFITRSPF